MNLLNTIVMSPSQFLNIITPEMDDRLYWTQSFACEVLRKTYPPYCGIEIDLVLVVGRNLPIARFPLTERARKEFE